MSQSRCEWYFPSNLLPTPTSAFIHHFLRKHHCAPSPALPACGIFLASIIPWSHSSTPVHRWRFSWQQPGWCPHVPCTQAQVLHTGRLMPWLAALCLSSTPDEQYPPALSMCSTALPWQPGTEIRPLTSFQTPWRLAVLCGHWYSPSPRKSSIPQKILLLFTPSLAAGAGIRGQIFRSVLALNDFKSLTSEFLIICFHPDRRTGLLHNWGHWVPLQ